MSGGRHDFGGSGCEAETYALLGATDVGAQVRVNRREICPRGEVAAPGRRGAARG